MRTWAELIKINAGQTISSEYAIQHAISTIELEIAMTNTDTTVNLQSKKPTLKRSLNLPLLVLYGLGTTIGAGIYVLIGSASGEAGIYAPLAFLVAAIAIAPSAASYAELAGRFPVSAAEAVYVEEGFRSSLFSKMTGLLVVFSGVVAAAAITVGCAGYLRVFVDWPTWIVILGIVVSMGAIAILGILESVMLAALFTLIEVGGLLMIVMAGLSGSENINTGVPMIFNGLDNIDIWSGIASAGLLAVFAFIGFEDMVNVVEETKKPSITMPLAIAATLLITAILYFLVTLVSVLAVNPSDLAQSEAPLSTVYEQLTGRSPTAISAIAVFATLNTILVQFIMASRVIYGLADRSALPKVLSAVNGKTHTPILATIIVVALTAVFALAVPLAKLAQYTSMIILLIWAVSNLALILIKLRKTPLPENCFRVPFWVPVLGLFFCGTFIFIALTNT